MSKAKATKKAPAKSVKFLVLGVGDGGSGGVWPENFDINSTYDTQAEAYERALKLNEEYGVPRSVLVDQWGFDKLYEKATGNPFKYDVSETSDDDLGDSEDDEDGDDYGGGYDGYVYEVYETDHVAK